MEISLDVPDTKVYVKSYKTSEYIELNDKKHTQSLIISPSKVLADNNLPKDFNDLSSKHLETLFSFEADIYLLGTGKNHQTPQSEFLQIAYKNQKPLDFMNSHAACRTFNILASEYRKIVALICLD